IAFAVWVNIASEPELSTILSAPVEFKNFPADLEISSNNMVDKIDVEAHGASGQLRDVARTPIAAILDFSSVRVPGERTFTLSTREISLPRGIDLIRTIPAQVRFTFEHRATRAVKVQVKFSGTLPSGLAVSGFEVVPPELTVAGPESRVAEAREAITDPFDYSQVRADSSQSLAVYMPEAQVHFLDKPRVTVSIHVRKIP
ncbi:MAG: CdaR family protein, partial [Acidobacteriota bacterium]|nr:CdaR family protein [Acidobacteriota bacterium]